MTAPTYTYTFAPTTDETDRLRLLLGDTGDGTPSSTTCIFADEEYEWFISEGKGNDHLAAHHACSAAASKYSKLADKTLGPMSISYSGLSANFTRQAEQELRHATYEYTVTPVPYSFTSETGDRDIESEEDDYKVPAFFIRNEDENYGDTVAGSGDSERVHWSFG
jgi:hypothetical protein